MASDAGAPAHGMLPGIPDARSQPTLITQPAAGNLVDEVLAKKMRLRGRGKRPASSLEHQRASPCFLNGEGAVALRLGQYTAG